MNSKKAQITIFAVLAFLLIAGAMIYFSLKSQAIRNQPEVPESVASKEADSINNFVTTCLRDTTRDAIKEVGKHGGFTSIKNLKLNPYDPTKSQGFIDDRFSVPYWFYVDNDDYKSEMPKLCSNSKYCVLQSYGPNNIQKNIQNYIENNIEKCLKNFSAFKDIYDINPGKLKSSVIILNDSVISQLHYPLKIKDYNTNSNLVLSDFSVSIPSKLSQMYDFASKIVEAESKYSFIEKNVLQLIDIYSGMDTDEFPPFRDIEFFDFSKKIWIRTLLEQKLKSSLLPLIGLTRIANARNGFPAIAHVDGDYHKYAQGLYNSFVVKLNDSDYDFDVQVFYPNSNIDFYINSRKELIKPRTYSPPDTSQLIKMFSLVVQDYYFKYFLTFPVIIRIHSDDTSIDPNGYDFYFAVEANIFNNVPRRGNFTIISDAGPDYLSLEDPRTFVNANITVETYDRHTDKPIDDVLISYVCGPEIFLGSTKMINNKALFKSKFPYCASNGYIKASKQGYASATIPFNNLDNDLSDKHFKFELWPYVKKQVYFWKRTASDIDEIEQNGYSAIFSAKTPLNMNESLYVNLNRVKENVYDDDIPLISFIVVNPSELVDSLNSFNASQFNLSNETDISDFNVSINANFSNIQNYTFDLVPGTYTVDGNLIYLKTITLPKQEFCVGKEVAGVCIGKTKHYPKMNLTMWPIGKILLNQTLTENELYNNKSIHFFVLTEQPPKNWTEMMNMNLDKYIDKKDYLMRAFFKN